ncbi:MAG: hypothetical protein JWL95_3118 [Gemmatimonadetes bacterium]|nr:hypothetical protein [Gemmatimonadota bacterium]
MVDSPTVLAVIIVSAASRAFGRAAVVVVESLFVLALCAALLVTGVALLFRRLGRATRGVVARPHFQIHW